MSEYEIQSLIYQNHSLIISTIASICSVIAIILTLLNINLLRKQNFEQNRGNIVFFLHHDSLYSHYYIVIKNFGKSPAIINSICTTPILDWSKTQNKDLGVFNIDNLKNIMLAPGQHIKTIYNFEETNIKNFDVTINYNTCGKNFSISYSIDLDYTDRCFTLGSTPKEAAACMNKIANSIDSLSDKLI